jgi:CBS domain containing-hemolysin-like protein
MINILKRFFMSIAKSKNHVALNNNNNVMNKILGKNSDDDICAKDIMFSRNDVEFLRISDTFEEILEIFQTYNDSYLPIIENHEIIGVIGINSMMKCISTKEHWMSYVQKVTFLSENSSINNVLILLHTWPMIVVVDEFGNAVGVITKQIFSDTVIEKVYLSHQTNNKEIILQGDMYIDELKGIIDLDQYNVCNVDTVNAFVICLFDKIPIVGEKIFIGDYEINVIEADKRYVKSVKITRKYLQLQ